MKSARINSKCCKKCTGNNVVKNGRRRGRCLGTLQQYHCRSCNARWSEPINQELLVFQSFEFRITAATICRAVALFAIGLSINEIEGLTRTKGETINNLIQRLVTSPFWEQIKAIVVDKTGISFADLHDLDFRQDEKDSTGDDVLHWQGYEYRRHDPVRRSKIYRKAKQIMARNICFNSSRS